MSFPKKVSLFIPWSKAMVAGATVGKEDYGKTARTTTTSRMKRKKRRRRRRKRARNGKKEVT